MTKKIEITVGKRDGSKLTSADLDHALIMLGGVIEPMGTHGVGTDSSGLWWKWEMRDEPEEEKEKTT